MAWSKGCVGWPLMMHVAVFLNINIVLFVRSLWKDKNKNFQCGLRVELLFLHWLGIDIPGYFTWYSLLSIPLSDKKNDMESKYKCTYQFPPLFNSRNKLGDGQGILSAKLTSYFIIWRQIQDNEPPNSSPIPQTPCSHLFLCARWSVERPSSGC